MTTSRDASPIRMISQIQKALAREGERPLPVRKKVATTGKRRFLQLKVVLKDISPPIWRRFVVPSDFSLAQLHECLQIIMGWDNYHLYEFIVGGRRDGQHYTVIMDGFDDHEDAEDHDLNFLTRKGMKFSYFYDFGDSWDHDIVAENVNYEHPEDEPPVTVLAGKRNCPPEDCGGSWGYANLVEALANKEHPEHEELTEWIGEYAPEDFCLEEVNAILASRFGKTKTSRSKKGTKKTAKKSKKAKK